LLIHRPESATHGFAQWAEEKVPKMKNLDLVKEVKFGETAEGRCVQILHVGPYSTEPESLAKLYELMEVEGFTFNGFHHEIYLSDPRKTPAERLRTILRQPVKEKG